jgi:predicted nucleic acid-binding protein
MNIIDSSTIVKFFSAEPGWEKLRKYIAAPLTIELSIKELGNALWKKARNGEFEPDKAVEVLSEFQRIAIILDQGSYIKLAFEIAVKYDITIYDSLFISAAISERYGLVTSDKKQARISEENGVMTTIV